METNGIQAVRYMTAFQRKLPNIKLFNVYTIFSKNVNGTSHSVYKRFSKNVTGGNVPSVRGLVHEWHSPDCNLGRTDVNFYLKETWIID